MASRFCCRAKSLELDDLPKKLQKDATKIYTPETNPYNCCTTSDNLQLEPNKNLSKAPTKPQERVSLPSGKLPTKKHPRARVRHAIERDVDPLDTSISPVSSHEHDDSGTGDDEDFTRLLSVDVILRPSIDNFTTSRIWERYPSHTRDARNSAAGMPDQVIVRDFAVTPSSDDKEDTSSHGSISWPSKRVARVRRQFGRMNANPLSRAMGGFRIGDHGHRSSIAYGGKLEFPELELLPVSKPYDPEPPKSWMTAATGKAMGQGVRMANEREKYSLGHFYDGSQLTTITELSEKSMRSRQSRHALAFGSSSYSSHHSDDGDGKVYDGNLLYPSLTGTRWSPAATQRSKAVYSRSFDGSNEHPPETNANGDSEDHPADATLLSLERKASGQSSQSVIRRQAPSGGPYDASLLHPATFDKGKGRSESSGHRRSASGKSNMDSVVVVGGSCDSLGSKSQYSVRSWWKGMSEDMQRSTRDLTSLVDGWDHTVDNSEQALIERALRAAEEAWKPRVVDDGEML